MKWICVVLEGFHEKRVKWWFLLKWCFDFKFYIVLTVFYVHKPINNLWEQIWMLGDQNLGFWVKNGVKTVTTGENSLETCYWQNLSGTFSQSAKISLSAKLHSDSIPCFVFLRLFHTFLFWIGLWCKHEVLDNWISFPMALVWHQNHFQILSYDGNTPSRYWRNFK